MIKEFEEEEVRNILPTKAILIEFLNEHLRKYCPPENHFSVRFGKQVLNGDKKLLLKSEVIYCSTVPRYKELSMKVLYKKVKSNERVL